MDIFQEIYRGTDESTVIGEEKKYIMNTYGRLPVVLIRGNGVYVEDVKGRRYIDFVSGIGVNSIGHCNLRLIENVKRQLETLIHVSNLYYTVPQVKLAKKLVDLSGLDKVFFSNSGAEANETAIKLARRYGKKMGVGEGEIITMEGGFHGRTLATITATSKVEYQNGFEPLPGGFKYVPFNNLDKLIEGISNKTTGIMIEPIQGEGGIHVADRDYLRGVRDICNDKGILLIFDEVQCGIGRTGKMFAYQNYGVKPDILTLAKALGGGIPIGTTLAKDEVAEAFTPGSHGSTFGGNPLACVSAYVTLSIVEDLLTHVEKMGEYFMKKLRDLQGKYPFIKDVRGMGLMLGMELSFQCRDVVREMLEKGYLINCTAEKVLRFLPPLIIEREHIDSLIDALDDVFSEIEDTTPSSST